MKTFTTTLALVLSVSVLTAMNAGSILRVKLLGHRPNMTIIFNGQRYMSADNIVTIKGLAPGDYKIKVLRPSYWGHHGVVFKDIITIPFHSKVKAKITPNGMRVKSEPLFTAHRPNYWGQQNGNGNGYGQNNGRGHGHGQHHGTTVTHNANGNGGFASMNPHHTQMVEPVCAPIMIGMHPDAFASALRSIDLATFDSDQIHVSKQIIRRNAPSSQQIAEIMRALSHESSRLEIAKFGYEFVADPENYFVVNDVFWFSSSIRELDRYINRY